MTDDKNFKVKKKWIYVAAAAMIVLVLFGFIRFQIIPQGTQVKVYVAPDGTEFSDYYQYYNYYMQKWGQAPPESPPIGTPPTRDASKIQITLQDKPAGASVSGTTTEVDIMQIVNGVADFLTRTETVAFSSATVQSALYYGQNSILVFHVLSDTDKSGGTDHYDAWYWTKLADAAAVYEFSPSCVSLPAGASAPYKYNWIGGGSPTGFTVQFTSGTTPYWDLGVMLLTPRVSAANLDTYLKGRGVTLASLTDGSTWVDTDGEITANHTMSTTSEDFYIEGYGMAIDVSYGVPQYSITQNGELLTRNAVLMMSTTMTSIGTSTLSDNQWFPISLSTLTAEKAFYTVIPAQIPVRSQKIQFSVKIPVDAASAASATKYIFKFWLIDNQVPAYVAQGSSSTGIPTAYGIVNEYGLDATIFARALTVSSGAGATEILRVYVTTP